MGNCCIAHENKNKNVGENHHSEDRNCMNDDDHLPANDSHNGCNENETQTWIEELKNCDEDQVYDKIKNAPQHIKSNKAIMTAAVKINGWALDQGHDSLFEDKDVMLVAVKSNGFVLQLAHESLMEDKDVVLEAVKQDGKALNYADESLRQDKDVVLEAVKSVGWALMHAHKSLMEDKDVILEAVKQYGTALDYAHDSLKKDKDIVMEAVKSDGWALQYAHDSLIKDKDILTIAIKSDPSSLQFASSRYTQDAYFLKLAKLWDTDYDDNFSQKPKIIMSTRFSLGRDSSPQATIFGSLMRQCEYFNDFAIYHPNVWNKNTCDPDWTNFSHPCRGTFESCQKDERNKQGKPTENSCWRYSYRYQLAKGRDSKGFAVQLAEYKDNYYHELGKGQRIEVELSSQVGIKLFQVFQPILDKTYVSHGLSYQMKEVNLLIDAVKDWYTNGCKSMEVVRIGKFHEHKGRTNMSNIHSVSQIYKSTKY